MSSLEVKIEHSVIEDYSTIFMKERQPLSQRLAFLLQCSNINVIHLTFVILSVARRTRRLESVLMHMVFKMYSWMLFPLIVSVRQDSGRYPVYEFKDRIGNEAGDDK